MALVAVNEPKSVSMIYKQRQQSRYTSATGSKHGSKNTGPGGNVNDNLNPVLPPLYPTCPKPTPLNPHFAKNVKVYRNLAQYFKSNFSSQPTTKPKGFYVDRYTDQYKSPLALKPHLVQRVKDSRYPDELSTKISTRKSQGLKLKRKIEDLPDNDDPEVAGVTIKKEPEDEEDEEGKEENNLEDMDDLEDDVDEEMDVGTDYAQSYFDNGEGDEDDRDDEDGPTY